ncbi:MAG: phosphatase PAP2 family protein [Patescibacteria group bacterium]|jgi:undecaprenyl-diphosphatase
MLFAIPPNIDLVITQAIQSYQPGWLTAILKIFTYATIPAVLVIIILAYLGFFHHHYAHQTKLKILLISAGNLLTPLLKMFFARPRPTADLVQVFLHESDYSFPSGHTIGIILFIAAIILLFYRKKSAFRFCLIGLCVLLTLIIPYSRIYLGVHWFTDILGGIFFSGLWIWLSHLLAKKLIPKK